MRRVVIALGLCMLASMALALGGQNMVLGRMVVPRADAPSIASTSHPRSDFVLHCAGCHGVNGAGAPLATCQICAGWVTFCASKAGVSS